MPIIDAAVIVIGRNGKTATGVVLKRFKNAVDINTAEHGIVRVFTPLLWSRIKDVGFPADISLEI